MGGTTGADFLIGGGGKRRATTGSRLQGGPQTHQGHPRERVDKRRKQTGAIPGRGLIRERRLTGAIKGRGLIREIKLTGTITGRRLIREIKMFTSYNLFDANTDA